MATITSFANENSLILGNREALIRQFNFGSWTEIRIGVLFRFIGNTNDTSSNVSEVVSVLTNTDRVFFGLKSTGSNPPGVSGSSFIGSGTMTTSACTPQGAYPPSVGQTYVNVYGTTLTNLFPLLVSGSSPMYQPIEGNWNSGGSAGFIFPTTPLSVSDYNGFYGLKFILQNAGSVSQSINMTYKNGASTSASSSVQLQSLLLSDTGWNTWASFYSASWAPSVPIPDSFFAYAPFYNNRMRMSAIQAIKIR